MNTKERMDLAQWAVKQAVQHGASEAAVDVVNSRDVEIEIRAKQVDQLNDATRNYLSLTVYANKRYSSHSTSDLRKASLDRFISEAVGMTAYLSQDEYRYLPEPKYYEGQKDFDLKTFDPGYDGLTSDEREKTARVIEEAARSRSDKVITCKAGFGDSLLDAVKVHSNGFEGSSRGTVFSAGAQATVRGESDSRPSDWDWRVVRFKDQLTSPEALGFGAVDRALARLGQTKLQSGQYDAIVENRTAARLMRALYRPLRASAVQQKRSFLDGKLGEQIASTKLTLMDDPFVQSGFGSRLYDGEGLATKKRVMIDGGILKQFYVDCYYGRKLGWEPTIGSPSNVVLKYGDKSLEELIAQTKRGILIDSFIGGNSSDITGEFSFGVMGHYIENGQRVQPVNEMNIAGTLFDLFSKLDEVGNDPWVYSSWRLPSLVFKEAESSGV
jgi:PmbA protein